jgi:hypothetical protein
LVPAEERSGREDDLFDLWVRGMGSDQGRIPVQKDEFMPAAELKERLEEFLSIDPHPAHMLVVMPQHDSDAHDFALRKGPWVGSYTAATAVGQQSLLGVR